MTVSLPHEYSPDLSKCNTEELLTSSPLTETDLFFAAHQYNMNYDILVESADTTLSVPPFEKPLEHWVENGFRFIFKPTKTAINTLFENFSFYSFHCVDDAVSYLHPYEAVEKLQEIIEFNNGIAVNAEIIMEQDGKQKLVVFGASRKYAGKINTTQISFEPPSF